VYEYTLGKVDWLARQRPIEGELADQVTVGSLAHTDVVTCGLGDRVGDVRERIPRSPYPFALVTGVHGVVLGRLRGSMLDCDPALLAERVMEPGPSTVRPHKTAATIAEDLAKRDFRWAIVTNPDGELIGVASRKELEEAATNRG
jgi:hypothetical protein